MTRDEVLKGMTTIFSEVLRRPVEALEEHYTARDVPGWDSLAHLSIIMSIEERYGIKLRAAQIARLKNVGEFIDVVIEKTGARR